MKKKVSKYDNLTTSLTQGTHNGSGIGHRLFGTAAAMVLQSVVATIAPIIVGRVLANTGIKFDARQIN